MQNMIQVVDNIGTLNVFFDINRETREIENVSIRDCGNVVHIPENNLEEVKSFIAQEYAMSTIDLALMAKDGSIGMLC